MYVTKHTRGISELATDIIDIVFNNFDIFITSFNSGNALNASATVHNDAENNNTTSSILKDTRPTSIVFLSKHLFMISKLFFVILVV